MWKILWKRYTRNIIKWNNIRSKISSEADKCLLEKIKDKRVYSVIDTNGNKFVFNEEYIMNYKVDLYLNENRDWY